MTQLQHVSKEFIHTVWPTVYPFVAGALGYSAGEYTPEQVKMRLVDGDWHLLVFNNEGTIEGGIVVYFDNTPNLRIGFVYAIGGKISPNGNLWGDFETWLRLNGASVVRGAARESVARLWRRSFGFSERYTIVEKQL